MAAPAARDLLAEFVRDSPRIHPSALGCAIGITLGGALFVLTAMHVIFGFEAMPIGLVSHYFLYYDLTWAGAAVGLLWGMGTGFVGGWLFAVLHNATIRSWLQIVRAKADLTQRRKMVDQLR